MCVCKQPAGYCRGVGCKGERGARFAGANNKLPNFLLGKSQPKKHNRQPTTDDSENLWKNRGEWERTARKSRKMQLNKRLDLCWEGVSREED